MNAGDIPISAYYQTTDPAQSKFYWGSMPTQYGSTYNPALDVNVPGAGTQGWGIQQSARAPTADEILQFYGGGGSGFNPFDPYSYDEFGFPVSGPVKPRRGF
jgi:hypothetical protein